MGLYDYPNRIGEYYYEPDEIRPKRPRRPEEYRLSGVEKWLLLQAKSLEERESQRAFNAKKARGKS